MRAVLQRGFGGIDQLERADVAVPEPAAGEVLVRVRAAGIDKGTLLILEGRPLLARPAFGIRRPKHPVPGLDVSGTVEAIGPGVTGFATGDEVVGISRGAFADYAVVPADKLALAPTTIDLRDAAALPVSGITALQAVRAAGISSGDSVLILGASGGVGHYLVQLAVAAGARVTAVCGAAKADFVRDLGAVEVAPYDTDDVLATGRTWDVVFDVMGNPPLKRLRRATPRGGWIVLVGGDDGGRVTAGYGRQLRAVLVAPFTGRRLTVVASRERSADIAELVERVERGDVRPHVHHAVPLDQAASAFRLLSGGTVRGKVVITT
jgi:NADPH:quinone reductase-like Zn-dependent oxidoreductase